MKEPHTQPDEDKLYRLSAETLRVGNAVSIVLLAIGIALLLWHKNHAEHHSHSLLTAWHSLLHGQPRGFLEVGLQTIILTPILTSFAICLYAIVPKRRALLIPSLLVIGGFVLSIWIGIGW